METQNLPQFNQESYVGIIFLSLCLPVHILLILSITCKKTFVDGLLTKGFYEVFLTNIIIEADGVQGKQTLNMICNWITIVLVIICIIMLCFTSCMMDCIISCILIGYFIVSLSSFVSHYFKLGPITLQTFIPYIHKIGSILLITCSIISMLNIILDDSCTGVDNTYIPRYIKIKKQ